MIHYPEILERFSNQGDFQEFLKITNKHPQLCEDIFDMLVVLFGGVQSDNNHKPPTVNLETLVNGFADAVMEHHLKHE